MQKNELPAVQTRMALLRGLPLTWLGYAADMLTLGFGAQGEFRLHIQCSYRLASQEAILFDRIDYFTPSEALKARWRAEGLEEDDFPREWAEDDCRLFERAEPSAGDGGGGRARQPPGRRDPPLHERPDSPGAADGLG